MLAGTWLYLRSCPTNWRVKDAGPRYTELALQMQSLYPQRAMSGRRTGTTLAALGAFLDREWQKDYILWGRLDGAERIIVSLLPDDPDQALRYSLIQEAAEIIVKGMSRPTAARAWSNPC
jgi:hypothetical protein